MSHNLLWVLLLVVVLVPVVFARRTIIIETVGAGNFTGTTYAGGYGINLTGSTIAIDNGTVCTSTNGLCASSGGGSGGWRNDSQTTHTLLDVNVSDVFFVNSSSGFVGVGTMTPDNQLTVSGDINNTVDSGAVGTLFHVVGASGGSARFLFDVAGVGRNAAMDMRRARGSIGAPEPVLFGDVLGQFNGLGYGNTSYSATQVGIRLMTAENWTDTAQGAYMDFLTTTIGSGVNHVAMTLSDAGYLGIYDSAPTSMLSVESSASTTVTATLKAAVSQSADTLQINNGSGSTLTVFDEVGHLGIGTTAPNTFIETGVTGGKGFLNNYNEYSYIFYNGGTANASSGFGYSGTGGSVRINSADGGFSFDRNAEISVMTINTAGMVGVNKSSTLNATFTVDGDSRFTRDVWLYTNFSILAADNASKWMSCGVYQNGTINCVPR